MKEHHFDYPFVQKFLYNAGQFPDRAAVKMGDTELSYSELAQLSGKVYRYLKQHGIGKEQFVMVSLPRSADAVACFLGIWRAGAAYVVCESGLIPDERKEFIAKDCNCVLQITPETMKEIYQTESLDGYEPFDEHDAAYAIYTSGTTGNPKGVLMERGTISLIVSTFWFDKVDAWDEHDKYLSIIPMGFSAYIDLFVPSLFYGIEFVMCDLETSRNPAALCAFMSREKITICFMTPSLFNAMQTFNPELDLVTTGGEAVSNIYSTDFTILNGYSQAEAGFSIGMKVLDRPYDLTPVEFSRTLDGKPTSVLLDDDGRECVPGEIGEICVTQTFFRGYINLPEQTEKVFKNGLYHTGDIAKKLDGRDLLLMGRKDDMIKFHGQRIVLAEIDAKIRDYPGIENAKVLVKKQGGNEFLAAFYTAHTDIDEHDLAAELHRHLESYKLPSLFVRLEKMPLNANGKIDRQKLAEMEVTLADAAIAAPQNGQADIICRAMEKVLGYKKNTLSPDADFFLSGGTSIAVMKLLLELEKKDIHLDAADIYKGRSAAGTAEVAEHKISLDAIDAIEAVERTKIHPLLNTQKLFLSEMDGVPDSKIYKNPILLKFDLSIDAEKLKAAVETALQAHPALQTVLCQDAKGNRCQKYAPELFEPVSIRTMTEEAFEKQKDTLTKPYTSFYEPLTTACLYKTEKSLYLYFECNHIFADGTSIVLFFDDIQDAYNGKELQKDYYFTYLKEQEALPSSKEYADARDWYTAEYAGFVFQPDRNSNNYYGFNRTLGKTSTLTIADLEAFEQKTSYSRSAILAASALKAIHEGTGNNFCSVMMIYSNRQEQRYAHTVCNMATGIFIGVDFGRISTDEELVSEVSRKLLKGIEHSSYDFWMERGTTLGVYPVEVNFFEHYFTKTILGDDTITEDILYDISTDIDFFVSVEQDGHLNLSLDYFEGCYEKGGVERFFDSCARNFVKMITDTMQ